MGGILSAADESAAPAAETVAVEGVTMFWHCDGCMARIGEGEPRLVCSECSSSTSFDLCPDCARGEPWASHVAARHAGAPDDVRAVPELYSSFTLQRMLAQEDSLAALFARARRLYAARPCLGTRRPAPAAAAATAAQPAPAIAYDYCTYTDLHRAVLRAAQHLASLLPLPLPPHSADAPPFAVLCGRNSPSWLVADLACVQLNIATVPVAHTTDPGALRFILEQTRPLAVLADREVLDAKLLAALEPLPGVVVVELQHPMLKIERGPLLGHVDGPADGAASASAASAEPLPLATATPPAPEDIFTVMWTSGSTGMPKGCIYTHRLWRKTMDRRGSPPGLARWVSFNAVAHNMERRNLHLSLLTGARIAFPPADANLFLDIPAIAPTIIAATPRFWQLLRARFQETLQRGGDDPESGAGISLEERMRAFGRAALGPNITHLVTGGARTGPDLLAFLRSAFSFAMVTDGYGASEVGAIATDGYVRADDVRLLPDADMGYDGVVRGELCVRTATMVPGYFRNAEETARRFTADGYFRTGDIGERDPATGRIRIIDRRRNIFKLAQGEFVSSEHVETALLAAPLLDQVYVYGEGSFSSVVAVAVLQPGALQSGDAEETARATLQAMATAGRAAGLQPFEIPCAVLIEPERFSSNNGLLTPSNKLSRGALEQRFAPRLRALYQATMAKQAAELASLLGGGSGGGGERDTSGAQPLASIDSLTAVALREQIRQTHGIQLTYRQILGCPTVADLAALVLAGGGAAQPDLQKDWEAECRLPEALAKSITAQKAAGQRVGELGSVLVTGATGFIGQELVRVLVADGRFPVLCLVRSADSVAARQLAETGAELLIGNLEAHQLGLDDDVWMRLARDCCCIIHNGAWVHSGMPYERLKKANVGGTLAVLELAAAGRSKHVHLVSSIGVLVRPPDGAPVRESAASLDHGRQDVLGGYGQSKFTLFLKSVLRQKRRPRIPADRRMRIVPVDVVAGAVVELCRLALEEKAGGCGGGAEIVHLVDSSPAGLSYADLFRRLEAVAGPSTSTGGLDHELEEVELATFVDADDSLTGLLPRTSFPVSLLCDDSHARQRLRHVQAWQSDDLKEGSRYIRRLAQGLDECE